MNARGQVLLGNADIRLVLDPGHGGAIREFLWRGRPVLRTAGASTDPFEQACFPLVPYVNRIAGGRFEAAGRVVNLAPNWSADPHPLHGQGWRAPWMVESATPSAAMLCFEGGGDAWPWRYCARQRVVLKAGGMLLRLSVENLSGSPMPAALGLHPYFPDAHQARLTAAATRVWLTDARSLPVAVAPAPPAWSFATGRAVSQVALDHCFMDWDGQAMVRYPRYRVRLRSSGCSALHVYVPQQGGFFCIEPQTVATGAFNRPPGEVPLLPPGAALAMTLEFGITES